jgi:hypothetical protein
MADRDQDVLISDLPRPSPISPTGPTTNSRVCAIRRSPRARFRGAKGRSRSGRARPRTGPDAYAAAHGQMSRRKSRYDRLLEPRIQSWWPDDHRAGLDLPNTDRERADFLSLGCISSGEIGRSVSGRTPILPRRSSLSRRPTRLEATGEPDLGSGFNWRFVTWRSECGSIPGK